MTASRTLRELVHQRLVDLQPARGVDDDDVAAVRLGALETLARRDDRVGRLRPVDRNLELAPELLELVDRSRTLQVRGDERRGLLLVLPQVERELGGRGRLARALQAAQEDDGRRPPERRASSRRSPSAR